MPSRTLSHSIAPIPSHAVKHACAVDYTIALTRAVDYTIAVARTVNCSITLARAVSRTDSFTYALVYTIPCSRSDSCATIIRVWCPAACRVMETTPREPVQENRRTRTSACQQAHIRYCGFGGRSTRWPPRRRCHCHAYTYLKEARPRPQASGISLPTTFEFLLRSFLRLECLRHR